MNSTKAIVHNTRLKFLLVIEALFYGVSSALTTGLLFVYIVSIGAGVEGISVVVGVSAIIKLITHILFYKYPQFLITKIRANFILNHGLDRIFFIFIPLTQNYFVIALIYSVAAATPTTAFMNLAIFGSFSEKEIKDVTAKRTATLGVSSILGYVIAIILLAFLPPETKFFYIYLLGVAIGLMATSTISLMNLSHLESIEIPKSIEHPEKLFSTSAYMVAMLAGGNLLYMVWIPYVMDHLKGPDYLAVAMNLVITLTSILASLLCKGWSFKALRYNVGLDSVTPILALATPIALIHPMLSAISSFTFTGSNFIASFLFAGYKKWLGAIKPSILMAVILCIANILVAPIGIFIKEEYFLLFLFVFGIKLIAFILASTTIPEVAILPEQVARTYSFTLYDKSIMGYNISVELSKDTIMLTLRLVGFSLVLLFLYVIYRILFLMVF
ncbi:MAG: hypothetical protein NWF08_04535 [Candidatus Bathyarchaeota archaeon]|nr:hypothetical protein [Candidatus Bathyarchaeota archaeon]